VGLGGVRSWLRAMCATGQVLALLRKEDTNPNRTCNPNPNPKPGRNGKGTRLCRLGWLVGGKPRRSRRIESSGGSFGCPRLFCVVSCFVFVVCTRMTATALSKRTIRPSVYWQVDDDLSSPGYRMNYLRGSDAAFQTAASMLRCRSGHHRASAIVHRALIR